MRFTHETAPPPRGLGASFNAGEAIKLVTEHGQTIWLHVVEGSAGRARIMIDAPQSVQVERTIVGSGRLTSRRRKW